MKRPILASVSALALAASANAVQAAGDQPRASDETRRMATLPLGAGVTGLGLTTDGRQPTATPAGNVHREVDPESAPTVKTNIAGGLSA